MCLQVGLLLFVSTHGLQAGEAMNDAGEPLVVQLLRAVHIYYIYNIYNIYNIYIRRPSLLPDRDLRGFQLFEDVPVGTHVYTLQGQVGI